MTPYFSKSWEDAMRQFALPEDGAEHTAAGVSFYQLGEKADDSIAA